MTSPSPSGTPTRTGGTMGTVETAESYATTAEAADLGCLRPGEASALLAGHPWRRFVAVGDSVALGVGDPVAGYHDLVWTDRIAAELRAVNPDLTYVNLGERELLAAAVRERQLAKALTLKPDLALVACGGNDAMRPSYRPDAIDVELDAIISALLNTGAEVMTVGMFDAAYAPCIAERFKPVVSTRMRTLSARTAAIAERYGTIHVNLTGHPLERDESLYSADGVHANMRSHAICAAAAIRRLGAHLRHTDA
jgi:lysophospholipase L1-like esterase